MSFQWRPSSKFRLVGGYTASSYDEKNYPIKVFSPKQFFLEPIAEYKVKAAFFLKFADFMDWPTKQFLELLQILFGLLSLVLILLKNYCLKRLQAWQRDLNELLETTQELGLEISSHRNNLELLVDERTQ